jgi:hypothetical protein
MFNRHLLKVLYDAVLDTPFQKVELGTSGCEPLELHALRTAKRVKELFAVTVQARLVGYVDREHLPGRGGVRHVVCFRIVGHKPLEFAKGYTLAVSQNIV